MDYKIGDIVVLISSNLLYMFTTDSIKDSMGVITNIIKEERKHPHNGDIMISYQYTIKISDGNTYTFKEYEIISLDEYIKHCYKIKENINSQLQVLEKLRGLN